MKRLLIPALLLVTATAAAEPRRAGVPVDTLTPVGLDRLEVAAPVAPGLPVRLVYGRDRTPEILVDVTVAVDTGAARAALRRWRALHQDPAPPLQGLGDEAYGGGEHVGFRLANVAVVVRRVRGTGSVVPLAMDAARAVAAAPAGAPGTRPVTLAPGDAGRLAVPAGFLDVRFAAGGSAAVRRDARGWIVARSGEGDLTLEGLAVDDMLRVVGVSVRTR